MHGLIGAHRVGKTTLAREFAKRHGWKFAQTSVSAILKELGLNPAVEMPFDVRLQAQEEILKRLDTFYAENAGQNVITDRTPIDLLAYTMADAIGDRVEPGLHERFERYVNACFDLTNRRFSDLLVVQPGIALVAEEGKAALNKPYIEHLNSLMLGLCADQRLKVPHFYIPRQRTDLEGRMRSVTVARQRALEKMAQEAAELDFDQLH